MDPVKLSDDELESLLDSLWAEHGTVLDGLRKVEVEQAITIAEKENGRRQQAQATV